LAFAPPCAGRPGNGGKPGIPFSVETSPATATREKLALLRDGQVDRISLGVQSFLETEAAAMGRGQKRTAVETALGHIREAGFPILNIDLIYGVAGQTPQSWLESLQAALAWKPEELFLYPLNVRPLTGLHKSGRSWADQRLALYRAGRDFLLEHGYTQVSMHMFRSPTSSAADGPAYCAQEDGMVGLGCGARSYTRELQYAMPYATGPAAIRGILGDYAARDAKSFAQVDHGFELDEGEQRRRYVALTLLNQAGLPRAAYRQRFGSDALTDLPQLEELETLGLASKTDRHLRLNQAGLERSDAIGPWLHSPRVTRLIKSFVLQ